jgi:hypothetical protein
MNKKLSERNSNIDESPNKYSFSKNQSTIKNENSFKINFENPIIEFSNENMDSAESFKKYKKSKQNILSSNADLDLDKNKT